MGQQLLPAGPSSKVSSAEALSDLFQMRLGSWAGPGPGPGQGPSTLSPEMQSNMFLNSGLVRSPPKMRDTESLKTL